MNKTFGAVLLVAGTTIGAGMLALPTVTGEAGFLPSIALFLFYWIYLGYTSLLILEVNLWMGPHANMISMAKQTIGRFGEYVSSFAYLFLLYALTTAYLAGSGPLVLDFLRGVLGWDVPYWAGFIPLLLIYSFFVTLGTSLVDAINRVMMAFLAISFALLIYLLFPHVEVSNLAHSDFSALNVALSVAATSFGFHIIIPSLTDYLERNVSKIIKSLIIGSFIPLVCYILWEVVTLGILQVEGPWGIKEGVMNGSSGDELLANLLHDSRIVVLARVFAFFAIATSFLGATLSLASCIRDGLRVKNIHLPFGLVDLLTFVPPLLIALTNPRVFLNALSYAGVFGVIVLLAFVPVWMVWVGRYSSKSAEFASSQPKFQAPGGKIGLIITLATTLILIGLEINYRIYS